MGGSLDVRETHSHENHKDGIFCRIIEGHVSVCRCCSCWLGTKTHFIIIDLDARYDIACWILKEGQVTSLFSWLVSQSTKHAISIWTATMGFMDWSSHKLCFKRCVVIMGNGHVLCCELYLGDHLEQGQLLGSWRTGLTRVNSLLWAS